METCVQASMVVEKSECRRLVMATRGYFRTPALAHPETRTGTQAA